MAGESVLVVDDSPTICKVVQLALTKAGFRVQTAPDGEQALTAVREARPDLVLLDFVMPKMNGYQFCRSLAEDKALADLPVVLMSAKGEEVGERFIKVASVVDYITKPFSPEAILAVVTHTIEKRARGGTALPVTAPAAGAVDTGTPGPEVAREGDDLAGNMAVIAVAEVLNLLGDQAQTGVLHTEHGNARVEIVFRKGRVDFAGAAGVAEEFLLGRFAVEAGQLDRAAFQAVLDERARSPSPRLLGTDLVARGLLTPEALKQAMSRQTAELIYEVLRWGAGRFSFRAGAEGPPAAAEAALQIPVDNLLLEGFRRVDEWRLIEREIESFDLIFVRDEERLAALGRGKLTREEIVVLELVNGKNSVKDLVRLSKMGSFDVTKMLYRLLRIKLVRRRVQPVVA